MSVNVMTISVLVYGISWIGKQFTDILTSEGIHWTAGTVRVDNLEDLRKELSSVNPTHVVSIIGRTHGPGFSTIDYLEQPGKLTDNVRDNLYAPVSLALECQARGIHYTYLGTGCIFEGYPDNGFTADSLPNFFGSSYSIVKGFTDRLMHQLPVLNLRIRMPITAENHPRNFITKIINYERICSIPNSMTYLPDLLPVAVRLMKDGRKGTVNLVNPGLISHNEILEMYKELVDPGFKWLNFTIEEQDKILASRRSNNLLNTVDMERMGVPDIKTSVRKALTQWGKIKLKIKAKLEIADHDGYCSGGECEYTCSIKTYIVHVPDCYKASAEDYKYLVNYLPTPNIDRFGGSGYCDLSDECKKNDLDKHSHRYTILEATELDD